MPDSWTLGKRIGQARREMAARKHRDITLAEIAQAIGTTKATVSRWEADLVAPREDALAKLAAYLGVTPAYLRYGVRETRAEEGMPQPDPARDRLLTEEEIERARLAVARKQAAQRTKRRGA